MKKLLVLMLALVCACLAACTDRDDGAADAGVSDSPSAYETALRLMDEGQYERAISAFSALVAQYPECAKKIDLCLEAINEREYAAAVGLEDAGEYGRALSAYMALNGGYGYRDSAERALNCREQIYLAANELLAQGRYEDAYEAYSLIKGYKDTNAVLAGDENLLSYTEELWSVGNTVYFGRCEQDMDIANGKERIEWLVLDRYSDGSRLLVSRYALFALPFNDLRADCEWKDCSLRTWLNESFLPSAFDATESAQILAGTVYNDRLFLLSADEAEKYFDGDRARRCEPTKYALNQGAYVYGGSCWWWLRSYCASDSCAMLVSDEGRIYELGYYVDRESDCVRPALRVDPYIKQDQ